MNIKEYKLIDGNEVFLTVSVSTPGIAITKVELTTISAGTEEKAVTIDGTGSLPKFLIDVSGTLKDSLLEISTDILLDHVPEEDWQVCVENLVITYVLEGGESNMTFNVEQPDKNVSDSGRTICVEKYIQLT